MKLLWRESEKANERIKPLSLAGLVVVSLAILPAWTIANYARGLSNSQEARMWSSMREQLRDLATVQGVFFADHARFGALDELGAPLGPRTTRAIMVHRGGSGSRAHLQATVSLERFGDSAYVATAVVGATPWVQGRVTGSPATYDLSGSVDWIRSGARRAWFVAAGLLLGGIALAAVAYATWPGGARVYIGVFALLVVLWLSTMSFSPSLIRLDAEAPGMLLGDSMWTIWIGP